MLQIFRIIPVRILSLAFLLSLGSPMAWAEIKTPASLGGMALPAVNLPAVNGVVVPNDLAVYKPVEGKFAFEGRVGMITASGYFNRYDMEARIDRVNIARSYIKTTIYTQSITVNNWVPESLIRQFLNPEKNPVATSVSRSIRP